MNSEAYRNQDQAIQEAGDRLAQRLEDNPEEEDPDDFGYPEYIPGPNPPPDGHIHFWGRDGCSCGARLLKEE